MSCVGRLSKVARAVVFTVAAAGLIAVGLGAPAWAARGVVVSGGTPGNLTVFNLATGNTVTIPYDFFKSPRWVAVTDDGRFAGVTSGDGKTVAWVDLRNQQAPVILGGDFNTSTASFSERWSDRAGWLRRLAQEPQRLTAPEAFEPLFSVLERAGYDWHACNQPNVPTQRFSETEGRRPLGKLDWFFTRGLVASDPRVVPAVRADGDPSSDHDALVVTIAKKQ